MKQFYYFSLSCLPSQNGSALKGKNFTPLGANSFFEEWTPFEELGPLKKLTGIMLFTYVKPMKKQRSASQYIEINPSLVYNMGNISQESCKSSKQTCASRLSPIQADKLLYSYFIPLSSI